MKVLYDLVYLEKEAHGGISKMWLEYFKKISHSNLNVTLLSKPKIRNIAHSFLKNNSFFNFQIIKEKSYKYTKFQLLSQLGFIRTFLLMTLIPKNIKLFHSTDYINPIFKRKNLKIVTTIHDLVFFDQKKRMKKNIWYWDKIWSIYHSLKISDQIITVSYSSKDSIIKHFPWAKNKINVIYHGLENELMNQELIPNKEKYFMFIGARNEYKNYNLLLNAFAMFIKKFPEWKLHVVGENKHTIDQEIKEYLRLKIDKNIIDHGLIDDKSLRLLLGKASSLIIPSLNEGFIFPLLEAMACGCPVLSSDIPVSKEIGKSYVTYFSNDKLELFGSMSDVANGEINLKNLGDAQKYAQKFTWENSFQKLLDVYKNL